MPISHRITQKATRILHAKGIELTPNQVICERQKAYAGIRAQMREKGFILPEDDEHLLAITVAMKRNEPLLQRKTKTGIAVAHPDFVSREDNAS